MPIATFNYYEAEQLHVRTTGQPPPQKPFVAIITGYAEVLRPGDTPPTDQQLENCFDASGGTADPVSGLPFFPAEKLPAGYLLRRYRWQALWKNLSSDGCGLRDTLQNGQTIQRPWKQAWYAINTPELDDDPDLDYPPVNIGTCVNMTFNRIGDRINNQPTWGYMFHFKPDPKGVLLCPDVGNQDLGCCFIPNVSGGLDELCTNSLDCTSLGGVQWIQGVPCPAVPCS